MSKRKRRKRKIFGTDEKPRLSIFRSISNFYAQFIDDTLGVTMLAVSSLSMKKGGDVSSARELGKLAAEKAKALGIKTVVFDRGTFQFHGRIKAFASAAREGGLLF